MHLRLWLILALALLGLPDAVRGQDSPGDYYDSGQVEYRSGKIHDAWTDFSIYCSLAPKDEYADYGRLFIWLCRVQLHQKTAADIELSDARQNSWNAADDDWVSKIADFYLDQITENDLLAAANVPGTETVNEEHCEAWYYAGMKHLLAGDNSTAITYFHRCLATDVKDFTEYDFAQAQLKALGE